MTPLFLFAHSIIGGIADAQSSKNIASQDETASKDAAWLGREQTMQALHGGLKWANGVYEVIAQVKVDYDGDYNVDLSDVVIDMNNRVNFGTNWALRDNNDHNITLKSWRGRYRYEDIQVNQKEQDNAYAGATNVPHP